METIHRLIESLIPRTPGSRELAEAQAAYEPVKRRLTDKLDDDPCASDPSRRECGPDVADVLIGARFRRERGG